MANWACEARELVMEPVLSGEIWLGEKEEAVETLNPATAVVQFKELSKEAITVEPIVLVSDVHETASPSGIHEAVVGSHEGLIHGSTAKA